MVLRDKRLIFAPILEKNIGQGQVLRQPLTKKVEQVPGTCSSNKHQQLKNNRDYEKN